MLKVQLCPASELENKYWWAPDAVACVVVAFIGWFGAAYLLDQMRHEIARLNTTSQSWIKQSEELSPVVAKFKNLDDEIQLLTRKIEVLNRITVSKIDKVLPVVVLEQLQTLKPQGVWFHSLNFEANKSVRIVGSSKDSLLISEFLLGLRETMNPDTWTSDLRTQIGYAQVAVKEMHREGTDETFGDQKDVLKFDASAEVLEKQQPQMKSVATSPMPRVSGGVRF